MFFLLCVIFGSFFVLNLMIAVQFSYLQASLEEAGDKNEQEGEEDDEEHDSIEGGKSLKSTKTKSIQGPTEGFA